MKKKAFPLSRVYTQLETGPVVLLTTSRKGKNNVMTLSWHTMIDFEPPIIGCVVSNGDYTFNTLRTTKECVIAIPTVELVSKVVKVGNTSGRDMDKFKTFGLSPIPASTVKAPLVGECLINLECKVVDTTLANKYNFFVLEVLKTDTAKSNQFDFTENVFAGYLNYSQKISEKIDFQAGLRAEQTNDNGTQYVHDTSFTRNYYNLFPSASLNWKVSNNNSLSFSYTRRIDRPDFDMLNPFVTVIDPYTYSEGNITLLPSISDQYEITYLFKQYLGVTLGHDQYQNSFKQIYFQNDSTHVTYSKPENINSYKGYNIMLNVSIPIKKWWNTVTSINIYHDAYYEVLPGKNINITNTSFTFKTLNIFSWKKNWNAEISFFYNSSDLEGLSITQPVYSLDGGIGRRFFNDHLTIKFSFSDIFMSQIYTTTQVYETVNIKDSHYWDDRKLKLGITWKFGKSEYKREENQNIAPVGKIKGAN